MNNLTTLRETGAEPFFRIVHSDGRHGPRLGPRSFSQTLFGILLGLSDLAIEIDVDWPNPGLPEHRPLLRLFQQWFYSDPEYTSILAELLTAEYFREVHEREDQLYRDGFARDQLALPTSA